LIHIKRVVIAKTHLRSVSSTSFPEKSRSYRMTVKITPAGAIKSI